VAVYTYMHIYFIISTGKWNTKHKRKEWEQIS